MKRPSVSDLAWHVQEIAMRSQHGWGGGSNGDVTENKIREIMVQWGAGGSLHGALSGIVRPLEFSLSEMRSH